MSNDGRQWSPEEIKNELVDLAYEDVIQNIPAGTNTPNLLLSTGLVP